MFSCYFDAAGGKDHGYIVVAGWVAPAFSWERFECDWRIALAKWDVPYFHMKEFSQSKGPYKAWKGQESKRANFLRTLAEIIKDYVQYGTGTYVDFNIFQSVNRIYCLKEWVGNEYSLAGRECAVRATCWAASQIPPELPVELFFEVGDEGQGSLCKLLKIDGYLPPMFRASRDKYVNCDGKLQETKGVIQLQAADFAAYELRKAKDLFHRNAFSEYYRKSMLALTDVNTEWRTYADKEDRLIEFCEVYGVPKRNSKARCPKRLG